MKSKKNKQQIITIIIISVISLFLIMNLVQAQRTQTNTHVQLQTQIEDAKNVLVQYYESSKQKDINTYIKLHDENYLLGIYGEEYKEFITEMLQIIDIENYAIKYQYYTENDEAITLFFNLNANTIIDGEKIKMDNDLVAFYTKTIQGPKLRYIMLQTVFKEQMITETILLATTDSIRLEEQDLVEEAKQKGIITNEQIENMFDSKRTTNLLKPIIKVIFWILLIIIFLGAIYYTKNKRIINTIKLNTIKTKKHAIILANKANKTYKEKVVPKAKELGSKAKQTYHEKIVPSAKKLDNSIKKTYNEKFIPKANELTEKAKNKSKELMKKTKTKNT